MKKSFPFVYAISVKSYLVMMLVPALAATLFFGGFGLIYSPSPVVTFIAALAGSLLTSFVLIEADLRSVAKKLGVSRDEVFLAKFGLGWKYKEIEDLREKFDDEFYCAVSNKEIEQKEDE